MMQEQGESFNQDIKTIEKIPGMLKYQHDGELSIVLKKRGCWQQLLPKNTEKAISGLVTMH